MSRTLLQRVAGSRAFLSAGEGLKKDRAVSIHLPAETGRLLTAAAFFESRGRTTLLAFRRSSDLDTARVVMESFLPEPEILVFPPWEILPYEKIGPSRAVTAERLSTLSQLLDGGGPHLILTTIRAIAHRMMNPSLLEKFRLTLEFGDEVNREALMARLVAVGYEKSAEVQEEGSFAVRGGIIDLWTPGQNAPVRIDFFGDQVESIRAMDPETQRSGGEMESFTILPVREVILSRSAREAGSAELKKALQPSALRESLAEAVSEGRYADGIEWYLPLIQESSTLFEYLPAETDLILMDPESLWDESRESWQEVQDLHRDYDVPLPEGDDPLFLSPSDLESDFRRFSRIMIHPMPRGEEVLGLTTTNPPLTAEGDEAKIGVDLASLIAERIPTILFAGHGGERERVRELLTERGIPCAAGSIHDDPRGDTLLLVEGEIGEGILFPDLPLAVLGRTDLFGRLGGRLADRRRTGRTRRRGGLRAVDWSHLRPDDYVVHIHYGIGIFRGIERIKTLGQEKDMLHLEYADGDVLYVPVDQMDRVDRYVGQEGHVPHLHKLGGSAWSRVKTRVQKSMENMARELLDLYAMRSALKGHSFPEHKHLESEFQDGFPYDETEDQLAALAEIEKDMRGEKPMDRLLCGDVGYGKTEIAMRAAFRAVADGRQVAVLVPTTVLAQQHLRNFRDRFAAFDVKIEMLSRFRTAKQQERIIERLREGDLDIVIGTHRLVQKDIAFKNLGLVIIDEEQRFGVRHKETLRQLRALTDVLTLTATPIPRTLHLSLIGARDISVINTPPQGRVPIVTIVRPFNEELLKSAVRREVERGGQVYVVHNRVQSIHHFAGRLREILPDVTFGVGHGQMNEHELAEVMNDLFEGRIDVLISTSIIESGLDIPNVNTIIIDRADRFGLSQLYQLRGRVGRGHHRAYAYFFYPTEFPLNDQAKRRLEAIAEFTALGSGFKIAMRDLEIRGAGNLLGPEQHGDILSVGFELYCRLLQETVNELKGKARKDWELPAVDVAIPSYLPESYIPDEPLRLDLYRKISRIESLTALVEMREELVDRFGALPAPVEGLLQTQELRIISALDGVSSISEREGEIVITYRGGPPVVEIMEILEADDQCAYRFREISGEGGIELTPRSPRFERFRFLKKLLRR